MMTTTTEELTNAQAVTLAIAALGGATKQIDTEDIAIKAYEICPGKFGWRKYPERIDLIVVRVSLNDAARSRPPLIRGSIKRGYLLTVEGMQWASTHLAYAAGTAGEAARRNSAEAELNRERERLRKSRAYARFVEGRTQDITERDFQEFTRINDYFPMHLRQKRFTTVQNAVSGDKALAELWVRLRSAFVKAGEQ
jgi:hypothetical protein